MNKLLALALVIPFFLVAFMSPASKSREFISDWVDISPGQVLNVEHGLGHRPLDVHVWTKVDGQILPLGGQEPYIIPIERTENLYIFSVSDTAISVTYCCASGDPVKIQVFAH